MRVYYGLKGINKIARPTAIAVGVFDGLHIGHKKIISSLMRIARDKGLLPVVVTFEPHPDNILVKQKKTPMLCSLDHRLNLLSGLGVSLCLVLRFNRAFAEKSCDIFIRDVLIKRLGMRSLVMGEMFSLGKEGVSRPNDLKAIADALDFDISIITAKRYNARVISSSIIRSLIEKGRLAAASRLLGRPVSVLGTVIHGRKRGRIIGFRTANIDPHHEAIPPSGVYTAYTQLDNRSYKSIVNIGRRPTYFGKEPGIEVHIFGVNKNIYGKDIEVCFVKRLRAEKRFKNEDRLREQIKKDVANAYKILAGQDQGSIITDSYYKGIHGALLM
jgi:riboflavin kinase / FMN adenylyltransferase